jgi:hypothetical protein
MELRTKGEKLAWAAGFIDGEGCIHLEGGHGSYAITVSVLNTVTEPLLQLRELFGGAMYPAYNRPGNKLTWVWRIAREDACACLSKVAPYMTVKYNEATLAILLHTVNIKQKKEYSPKLREIQNTIKQELKLQKQFNE